MQFGVPVKTIYDWKDRYLWKGRWLGDVHALAPEILDEGMSTLVQGWPLATARLLRIIATGSDKDAVNAIRVYLALGGASNRVLNPDNKGAARGITEASIEAVKEMTPDQLWEVAAELGAVNMDKALRLRRDRKVALPQGG